MALTGQIFVKYLCLASLLKLSTHPFSMKINQTKQQINLTFVFPCIVSVITNDNQQDVTILIRLHLISVLGGTDLSRVHPIRNTSQQQHR